ncbi:discoidin domain-containing protein [Catellatospora vulcania]|uniref:discoidin domain-containing protein n=1 Tax=Catellatospora vulcania TaxID=1460450 RepID=UPI0012D49576|nr:discoidin domain-containing protein [Catellatospora vulcania]
MRVLPGSRRFAVGVTTLALAATGVVVTASAPAAAAAACDTATNIALNKPATASSVQGNSYLAARAVDGNDGTRWSSQFSDPQWIQVDLGPATPVCQVVINWQTSYAKAFRLELSDDGANWTSIYSATDNPGGLQTITATGTGRYLRMYGTQRANGYGYSIKELIVHRGDGGGGGCQTPPPVAQDLGPNVVVFDPSMSSTSIQSRLDAIFAESESAQFGTQRYAVAFKPGTYSGINANTGFYTSVMGLGRNPDDVTINGDVTVDAGWFGGNATQNFWRSIENLAIVPSHTDNRWAVSQAAPMRRVHIRGGLNLAPDGYGWASGGYIADSKIDGRVGPYSQQQWYTRDSQIGSWGNAVWNMVFSGVVGAPANGFPSPAYTTLPTTPRIREKPYLYLDGPDYHVFVPNLRTNAAGTTWSGGSTPGSSLPLTRFHVARPTDTAGALNNALACGKDLLFTPGVYHLNQTLKVTRANTVVLGIGYPTLIPDNGIAAMTVADVDGVKLAGLLLDAGPVNSPYLLQIGPAGATVSHAANPTTVQDVFFRVGGAGPGKVSTALIVNSADTILDHIWAWRADHGSGVGWTVNPSDTGLIVNGANVSAYGLFVEHFNKYQVIWNGQGGRTIFFQNEMPYDPPSQSAWRTDGRGYAAYKVADSVTSHEAWGLGSYCVFTADPSIVAERGFEAPVNPNVKFHSLLTISFGKGSIEHVVNNTGASTGTTVKPVNIVSFP